MICWSERVAQVAVSLFLSIALCGCKATPPGKYETKLISGMKRHVLVGKKNVKNPTPVTSESIASGRTAFSHFCAACHGLDGQNTGVPFADKMSPPVPSLASATVQAYSDGQLKWVIDNGIWPSGMPSSKSVLNEDEIWSIIVYIRHLPPAGSLGEPAMYSGECEAPKAAEAHP